ncbi:MAG: hypothetical protein JXR78_15510 [Victivallales bacterium]|nr:hypothetical protein [Victivallales bacterium]
MRTFIFCAMCLLFINCKGLDVLRNNYYIEAATLFNDMNQIKTLQVKDIKINCVGIDNNVDSKIYKFNTSSNRTFTVVVGDNYCINNINDIKAPTPLLAESSKNKEWIELSKLYFHMAITKASFLNFANVKIVENESFNIIIEDQSNDSFSIIFPLSFRKRVVRYLSNNLLQLRDYDGEKLLQEINFYPETTSIYRMYIIGEMEVTFFVNGGINSLIKYDKKTKKAVQGKKWSKDGILLEKRDFIKNPVNYREIKIQK